MGSSWRSVTFDWNRARAFLVTAEEGSFSAAARALGMTQPTIGRQVAALEEELGVTLFERVGNQLELTAAGLELLEQARAMGEAAAQVSLVAAGRSAALEGVVSLTASELIAAHLLPPIVTELRRAHPGIQLEIVASNEPRDLRRREADIAIRNFQPKRPDLVARKIGESFARPYATPAYLESLGPIDGPADLAKADWFGFDRSERMIEGLGRLGIPLTLEHFPIVTDNHLVQWQLCLAGAGIGIAMDEVGENEPKVRPALEGLPPFPVPIYLVAHRELRTSRRMRVVFDFLAERWAERYG